MSMDAGALDGSDFAIVESLGHGMKGAGRSLRSWQLSNLRDETRPEVGSYSAASDRNGSPFNVSPLARCPAPNCLPIDGAASLARLPSQLHRQDPQR